MQMVHRGAAMPLTQTEKKLIQHAAKYPGLGIRKLCEPFLSEASNTTLYLTVKRLIDHGYLIDQRGTQQAHIKATKKGKTEARSCTP
jgi:hypothetical protein